MTLTKQYLLELWALSLEGAAGMGWSKAPEWLL